MEKEDLVKFLRENLEIDFAVDSRGYVIIDLKLEGENISRTTGYIPTEIKRDYWD
jgi:hypothetical protein